MAKFDAVKKITITEQIMDQIATLITSGELKAGEQLPTERDLAVQLGVTRGRVREALRALSLVGLITIKAGEGSFVANMEAPVPEDTILWMFHKELHNLDEVYAARQLIESAVYVSASQHMEAVTLDQLELLIQKFVENYDRNSPEELLEQLDRIDLYVGEHCGNRIYNKLMQTIVHLRRETNLKLLRVPGSAKNGASGRLQVLTALRSGKSDETKLAMEAFFASSFKFYQSIGS